ncbi:hypothetical protein Tco_1349220, partial [Tanacetum coccineum]
MGETTTYTRATSVIMSPEGCRRSPLHMCVSTKMMVESYGVVDSLRAVALSSLLEDLLVLSECRCQVHGSRGELHPIIQWVMELLFVDVLPRFPMPCFLLLLVWSRVTICREVVAMVTWPTPGHVIPERCDVLPEMVANSIDSVTSILTQKELDLFCATYNISAELRPKLPGREDTIKDSPKGKIGIYTRFIEFANFRIPLSRFLFRVLEYYQINFSQLSVLGKVPLNNGWLSFSRHGSTPCCLLKKNDSRKNWNDHFFWIDATVCPISVLWNPSASVVKDLVPSVDHVNTELLDLLNHHRTVIRRYPEVFLCLIGLSRSFNDPHVYPTLLKDDGSDMGLLDFVKTADPFKVRTGERTLAEEEVPLNDETVNMTVAPSTEIIRLVEHTIVDELGGQDVKKKKRNVAFGTLPAKKLRTDEAMISEPVPTTTAGKSPAALKRNELQSGASDNATGSASHPTEEFVSSSVTPTPETDVYGDSASTQDATVRGRRVSSKLVVTSSSRGDD